MTKACWAQRLSTETLRRLLKGWIICSSTGTEIQARYQRVPQSRASLPHRYGSHHLKAKAFTPTKSPDSSEMRKKHCRENDIWCMLLKVFAKEWVVLMQKIWTCRSGNSPLMFPHSLGRWVMPGGKNIDLSTVLWLFLTLPVTVASGESGFFYFESCYNFHPNH